MKKATITLGAILFVGAVSAAFAQGTAFTYQGRLNDGASPVQGIYDLRFTLHDAASAGAQQGNAITNTATSVSNGLFSVTLDFGNQFPGADRWLEIGVRTNGGSPFTTLIPRQKIASTPYAIQSANAASAISVSGAVSAAQLTGTISSNNIGAGSIGAEMLAAGAVTTAALADGAVTATKVATVSDWFALTIANPTAASSDTFGSSVAAIGTDRMLIGAPGDDLGANGAGVVYLFSTQGALLRTFSNPTPAEFDNFGVAVAALGSDRVLIGADRDDTGTNGAGAAYLFNTNAALLMTFINPTPAADDSFGFSVAAVGSDRVLIGADLDDTGATNAGAAYLFSTNGALLMTFTNPTPALNEFFSRSMAAVGTDRVLIGAPNDDTGATNAGAAYLFSTNGALLMTFTNPTPAINDNFGISVAAVGTDRVLIGSPHDDTGAGDAGAAYLFSTNGALLTNFFKPTPTAITDFGSSVAAVGSDRVLIGAISDGTGAFQAGAAYLFSTNGVSLATFTNPTPAIFEEFGSPLTAVGTDRVLIAARRDDTGASAAGAAYLFSIETYTPGLVTDGVNARSITTANLEDGAVTAAKIGGTLYTSQIPDLDASKITSGVFLTNRIPNLDAGKITSGVFLTNRIPNLDAGKITSGVFAANRIPNLDASKITSGTLSEARLSANVALLDRPEQTFTGTNLFTTRVGIGTDTPIQRLTVGGSGGFSAAGAAAIVVTNTTATRAWEWHVFNDGRMQLADYTAGLSRLVIETNGNVGIGTGATNKLHVLGGATFATGSGAANQSVVWTPGSASWSFTSDRAAKERLAAVNAPAVLEKVARLPITEWSYIGYDRRHIGPMAQDFHAEFPLNGDDKSLNDADLHGVALAAIQGLNEKVESAKGRAEMRSQKSEAIIQKLQAENAELKQRLEKLERLMNQRVEGGK